MGWKVFNLGNLFSIDEGQYRSLFESLKETGLIKRI